MFLALFWAYIGQPDNQIGWVKESVCEILAKIVQLLVVVEKLSFFESAVLNCDFFFIFFFFSKKFFCLIPIQINHKLMWYHGWDSIFMITMISTKIRWSYRIFRHTVLPRITPNPYLEIFTVPLPIFRASYWHLFRSKEGQSFAWPVQNLSTKLSQ